jgi:hypothetical protein
LAAGCHFTGPLALRPCFSAGLPLSVKVFVLYFVLSYILFIISFKKIEKTSLVAGCHFTGPLALRPCFSAGLPLSVKFCVSISLN